MPSRTARPLSLAGCVSLCLFLGVATAAEAAPGLEAAEALPTVTIIGTRAEARLVPGAVDLITLEELDLQRPFTANEALRRAPGVNVRDEEGFGLRPNIGIRGLNPTRSSKITLLEDGLPLAYAPYGDNASYFHPPIERYSGIEVLRGTSALAYGPQTIGGVINYLTPDAPEAFAGFMQFGGGTREYLNAHARVGGSGFLADYVRKQGEGARDHLKHAIDDLNLKYSAALSKEHSLKLRLSLYQEDSIVTYSGLTQAEYERLGARYNPFENDGFDIARQGASLSHRWSPSAALTVASLRKMDFASDMGSGLVGEDLREVQREDGFAFAGEPAADLQQAGRVRRDDVIGAGPGQRAALHLDHRGGDHRELGGEEAAEAAAGLAFLGLDELEALDRAEQLARLFLEAELAEGVTAVMVGDLLGERGADVGHAELVHQEFREFVGPAGEVRRRGRVRGVLEQLRVELLDHRHAGARGADDHLGPAEDL